MPDPKPKELLEQLKNSLAQDKQKSVDMAKEISVLESRVADLTKITAEIEQKVDAYKKARTGLSEQRKKSEDFVTAKKELLSECLPDEQGIIDKKTASETALQEIKNQVDQYSNAIEGKQDALDAAQVVLETKKREYAAALDLSGSLTRDLKELQDLEKLADQENSKNNFGRMYFYVLEMESKLAEATVPLDDAYRNSLEGAAASLAQATEDVRQKKEELDTAKVDLKAKQAEYEEAKAKRRQKTAEEIQEGIPPAPDD